MKTSNRFVKDKDKDCYIDSVTLIEIYEIEKSFWVCYKANSNDGLFEGSLNECKDFCKKNTDEFKRI